MKQFSVIMAIIWLISACVFRFFEAETHYHTTLIISQIWCACAILISALNVRPESEAQDGKN